MSIVIDMNNCDIKEYFNIDSNGKKVIYIYNMYFNNILTNNNHNIL